MKVQIPAKTFIIGEYSALVGGSVLACATSPGFETTDSLASYQLFQFPFSPDSPAGKLWHEMKGKPFQFHDHVAVGGFGKSTAEYLSVLIPSLNGSEDFQKLREKYVNLSQSANGSKVSGLDLATQYFGGVLHFDSRAQTYTSYNWNFPELDFIIVSTGVKIKTHEHLEQLSLSKLNAFPETSDALIQTYFDRDYLHFVRAVKEWSLFLKSHELIDAHSEEITAAIAKLPDVLVAKPCGAMGADVALILCDIEKSSLVQKQILDLGFAIKGDRTSLAQGVRQQISPSKSGDLHVD